MDITKANLFVTGGAGTLGRAIARRRKEEGWTGRLTVYSTTNHNHNLMRKDYPDVQYVQGDIRNADTLYLAMCGHDVCIHAAAVKVIPDSEHASIDTYDVNVNGSLNVFNCAVAANVERVMAISTDKACHAANAYGASKYMMEKMAQEFSRVPGMDTQFHLVRYGNVLESTGSVIEFWKKAIARREPIKITDPGMTRFWLSPQQAVQYVMDAFDFHSGNIYIPKMPALSIGKLAQYAIGEHKYTAERIPLRPGEKMHETLLTVEEIEFAVQYEYGSFVVRPTTAQRILDDFVKEPYTSDTARELTPGELELVYDRIP